MLIRGAEACGTDMGILLQTTFQFTGKGLTFRLRGIVTQDQAGRTGKPGQAQPEHGACLQRQQGHEGQPAPAGSQHFHRLEGRQVQLDQQHQDNEHEKGRSRFQQSRDKRHVSSLYEGRMRGPAREEQSQKQERACRSGSAARRNRSQLNTGRVSRMSGTGDRDLRSTEGPGKEEGRRRRVHSPAGPPERSVARDATCQKRTAGGPAVP